MTPPPFDIKLGGKGYLVAAGQYSMGESPKSFPTTGGASAAEFKHSDNWIYWGQSDFVGDSVDDWFADGPFNYGYGLDLDTQGRVTVAKRLALAVADATNIGHIGISIGTTRQCWLGKTDGTMRHSTDGTAYTTVNLGALNYLAAGNYPRSKGELKGSYYVGTSNGHIWSTTDGLTWTDKGTGGPTTDAYILAAYKGKLYVGYTNKLYTYDGTTWAEVFSGLIDGTPTIGAVATSFLYFATPGPGSVLYMTDSNQLHQLGTIGSRFVANSMKVADTIYLFGKSNDATYAEGEVKRISQAGIETIYQFGDDTKDNGIRCAIVDGDKLVWGANHVTGLGVYDPKLDLYQDVQTGFYVGSTLDTLDGIVDDIIVFKGDYYCAVQGAGIYKQTTPGKYLLRSTLFDGNSKNINKFWGFSELAHTPLVSGQTVTLKTSKDSFATSTAWGTSNTVGATSKVIAAPSNYKAPYLQYELSGDANGSPLAITSISLAYLEVADNPKREWRIAIDLDGTADLPQLLRDGSDNDRTAVQMLNELNGLWNTVTTFGDIDGRSYSVILKHPYASADDILREQDEAGNFESLVLRYQVHLTEL